MNKLSKAIVALAGIFVLVAILIKLSTARTISPAPIPVNWLKLTDTFLLFSIAISLLNKK